MNALSILVTCSISWADGKRSNASQDCQMLDKEHGNCWSSLWQSFGKNMVKIMAMLLALFTF